MSEPIWDWTSAGEAAGPILDAASLTLLAGLLSFGLALVLGLFWAVGKRARFGIVRVVTTSVTEFIRRTPPLIQLYVAFFLLPEVGVVLAPLATGVLTLGLHFSTYIAEVYRGGIESVGRGQWDAGASLGLTRTRTLFSVILPQALPPIVPALGNYLIIMFKETPLLSAIAVLEMLERAKIIGSYSFRYTEPITEVGLIFLALSLVSAAGIRYLEHRLWRGRRTAPSGKRISIGE